MEFTPHANTEEISVNCAVITVSDTRSPVTDKSGQLIQELLLADHHIVELYQIIKDESREITAQMEVLAQYSAISAVIFNGGTGIAPRDTTYD
ncbi:MAG: molybdenum cofactor biosynthesis protein B, partial [Dolichospermum sp.]